MKLEYVELTIENDKNNNIYLFAHKISQFIKYEFNVSFGVYSKIFEDSNNGGDILIRLESAIDLSKLEFFLKKQVITKNIVIEINNGDSFLLEIGFKPNHIKTLSDKSLVLDKDIDKLGYFPNFIFKENYLLNYINKKPIIDSKIDRIQVSSPFKIKLDYSHNSQERKLSVNRQNFILLNIIDINEDQFKNLYIQGVGVKKSYGFSRITKIDV